jgi:hypothetical protein
VGELRNVRVSKIHKTAPFFPLNAVASDRVRGDVERIVW